MTLNCAAVPQELIESELFGHEKGAFTGAAARHAGKFEQAHRGTLFLDEIGDMPAVMQAKLLRVLEEGEIERVGGSRPMRVDVRVVVATHRNLEEQVPPGAFRQDLYHRIYVFPILLPPLRERPGDIAVLVDHFARQSASRTAGSRSRSRRRRRRRLNSYSWPGNVRELRNSVERLLLLADEEVDEGTVALALPHASGGAAMPAASGTLAVRVEHFERDTIAAELDAPQPLHDPDRARALGRSASHFIRSARN